MNIRRIVLSLSLLLAVAAPVAQAGGSRHVEINVGFGHYLPPHPHYVREVAPVIVYEPVHHGYYQPQYRHYQGHNRHHARHCKNRYHNHGRGHYGNGENEDDDD